MKILTYPNEMFFCGIGCCDIEEWKERESEIGIFKMSHYEHCMCYARE
jgi:hypothetical protein